jgi:hypothetical protein
MADDRTWPRTRRGGSLRSLAWTAAVVLLLTACGGGGESLPDVDLGGGISMTPDGAIIVKSSSGGSGEKT